MVDVTQETVENAISKTADTVARNERVLYGPRGEDREFLVGQTAQAKSTLMLLVPDHNQRAEVRCEARNRHEQWLVKLGAMIKGAGIDVSGGGCDEASGISRGECAATTCPESSEEVDEALRESRERY